MVNEAYELFALFMRYIYVLIGVLILWRAFRWLRRDAKRYRREMRALPDAGLVGEIVDLKTGKSQPLPREGMMGAARSCDIRVHGTGVKRRHALFAFEPGKGLRVTPQRGCSLLMAGVELHGPAHALHGTQLQIGDSLLRVRLFAGLKVPTAAQFQADAEESLLDDDAPFTNDSEGVPAPFEAVDTAPADMLPPSPMPGQPDSGYAGDYTEDGQMTWQYAAYPLEQLYQAQADQESADYADEPDDDGQAAPYQSPVPRRRRRSRR